MLLGFGGRLKIKDGFWASLLAFLFMLVNVYTIADSGTVCPAIRYVAQGFSPGTLGDGCTVPETAICMRRCERTNHSYSDLSAELWVEAGAA